MKHLILPLILLALAASARAQDATLSGKLSEAGAEWLVGSWTGTDQNDQPVRLTYALELGGHAGSVHLQSDGLEMKGLIAVDASTDEIRQFGVTDVGAIMSGSWRDDGGGLVLEATWVMPSGSRYPRSYVYQRIDANRMKVVRYDDTPQGETTRIELVLTRTP